MSMQISIENERKFVRASLRWNLSNFFSTFNWKWKEFGLGQSRIESDSFLFKFQLKRKGNSLEPTQEGIWLIFILFQLKMKRNRLGRAQDRIWLIFIQVLIENERNFVWAGPGRNLMDFSWISIEKRKEIGLGLPSIESDSFLFKFQLKMKGNSFGPAQDGIWLISIEFQLKIKRNWSGAALDKIGYISIQISNGNEYRILSWR